MLMKINENHTGSGIFEARAVKFESGGKESGELKGMLLGETREV